MFDRLVRKPYASTTTPEYTSRFATSWFLSPLQLATWRGIVALYAFLVIFIKLGIDGKSAGQSFSYFTVLGYWGLAFYYAVSCAHSASFWWRGKSWLESWPKPLRWLHSVFYTVCTVFPFIVTAVFWAVLSSGAFDSQYSSWSNISEHALNSVMAFVEIMIPRTLAHPWINILPMVVLLALYLALAYITHSTQHFWVYGFLDPENGQGLVAGAIVGILAASILVFTIVHYLIVLREWITETKCGLYGNLSSRKRLARRQSHESVDMNDLAPKTCEA